jgi:hypothetical protein
VTATVWRCAVFPGFPSNRFFISVTDNISCGLILIVENNYEGKEKVSNARRANFKQ